MTPVFQGPTLTQNDHFSLIQPPGVAALRKVVTFSPEQVVIFAGIRSV